MNELYITAPIWIVEAVSESGKLLTVGVDVHSEGTDRKAIVIFSGLQEATAWKEALIPSGQITCLEKDRYLAAYLEAHYEQKGIRFVGIDPEPTRPKIYCFTTEIPAFVQWLRRND